MTHYFRLQCYTLLIWLCYAVSFSLHATPLDKTKIKEIVLNIDADTVSQQGLTESQNRLLQQIKINLSQWQFPPLVLSDSKNTTHQLTISIGKVEIDSTPVGFSFSAGNSDPRAQNFQKAKVLPIKCRLTAKQHPEQQTELNMTFQATDKLTTETLIDHASTVCFDLLDDLNLVTPETTHDTEPKTLNTPAWMPKVKVKTVKEPQVKMQDKEQQINVPTEERKELIIENQGSPVILKLGHDRL